MNEFITTVEDEAGERIDKFLSEELIDRSRSFLQKLIKEQYVKVNGKPVKSSYRLISGDLVCILFPEPERPNIAAENILLNILYEDDDIIVVNKPKQMVVHPAPGHYSGTLVNALLYHCQDNLSGINGSLRPGIVHRIDMDTTGSLVICKNDAAHQSLSAQLKNHSIHRVYEAVVHGNLKEETGLINAPIGRHPTERKKMSTLAKNGREAVTHYRVLERFGNFTYIQCRLETGRTHQIRVHMKHIGHPLFNDVRYGGDAILRGLTTARYRQFVANCFDLCPRQALHARTLGFTHPDTGRQMDFEAPVPADMQALTEKWRVYRDGAGTI